MDGHEQDDENQLREGASSQGAFIYQADRSTWIQDGRPTKKRKISKAEPEAEQENRYLPFQQLLNGEESASLVKIRRDTFRRLWSEQEDKIQTILQDLDAGILEDVTSFIATATGPRKSDGIPTALIQIGSNVSALTRMLDRLNQRLLTNGTGAVVALESGDALNLKTVLKNIIRNTISNRDGNEGYQNIFTDRVGPRILPYDLEALYEYQKRCGMKHLVLAFRDSEAFDQGLLNDLLSLLNSWNNRIPFTLIFGISTSTELFESRLPRSIAALLKGKRFKIHDAGDSINRIYDSVQTDESSRLWLGHQVSASLFDKSRDYFHSPEGFSRKVKFAFMSHFFANPLSSLLTDTDPVNLASPELVEAIRNVASFRDYCEDLLEKGQSKQVVSLLNNDKSLMREVAEKLRIGQQQMRNMFACVKLIANLQKVSKLSKAMKQVDLAVLALAGALRDSPLIEELLLVLKKMNSQDMMFFLDRFDDDLQALPELQTFQEDLGALLKQSSSKAPLRSKYSDEASVLKTAVVGQRVSLSKSKANLSQEEIKYNDILERFFISLGDYLSEALINPQELFLKEVFLFDLRSPLRETFAPKIRFAIERALLAPFDYLFAAPEEMASHLSSAQPKTALLYQLYLESGSLMNVFDLWKAFSTILGGEDGDQMDERLILAFFYQALSELKAMGMVKASRKKIDHVSKSAWKGL